MRKSDIKIDMNLEVVRPLQNESDVFVGLKGKVTDINDSTDLCILLNGKKDTDEGFWFSPEELEEVKEDDKNEE